MVRVIGFAATALIIGWALAWLTIRTNLPTGWVGAAILLGWAITARQRWMRLKTQWAEPSGPERVVWHRLASAAIAGGHLLTALTYPQIELRLGSGNWLAIDSWIILAAIIASALLFRGDNRDRDERDRNIAAMGLRVSYITLVAQLLILSFILGFAPYDLVSTLSLFFIANLLIALIVMSTLANYIAQLLVYARDTQEGTGLPS